MPNSEDLREATPFEPPSRAEALGALSAEGEALQELLAAARHLRDLGHGRTVTYSPKAFFPVTNLCRDRCAYCTFRRDEDEPGAWTMQEEEIRSWSQRGRALGCVVDGCPPLIPLTEADLQPWLDQRKPGGSRFVTQRRESDTAQILSGVFDRFPKLDVVLSHGGGHLPFLIGRFDRMHITSDRAMTGDVAAKLPSDYVRQFHYDTILNESLALQFLKQAVGIDRIVLGTDEPFPVGDPDPLNVLRAAGFSDPEIEKIGETNPRALYRSL